MLAEGFSEGVVVPVQAIPAAGAAGVDGMRAVALARGARAD
jgi:hypothetical protein